MRILVGVAEDTAPTLKLLAGLEATHAHLVRTTCRRNSNCCCADRAVASATAAATVEKVSWISLEQRRSSCLGIVRVVRSRRKSLRSAHCREMGSPHHHGKSIRYMLCHYRGSAGRSSQPIRTMTLQHQSRRRVGRYCHHTLAGSFHYVGCKPRRRSAAPGDQAK